MGMKTVQVAHSLIHSFSAAVPHLEGVGARRQEGSERPAVALIPRHGRRLQAAAAVQQTTEG
jgi:hypothetical protein